MDCSKLEFTATRSQRDELDALAYWVANENYMRERYGDEEPELQVARDTIEKSIFPALDRAQVPFWVQNFVMAFAEDWRRYICRDLWYEMRNKHIFYATT